jgi:hypothetical protein
VAELLDQSLDGLVELAVGEDAGSEAEDVVAQVADDPVQLLDCVLEAAAEVVVAGQQGRALEAHADREQGLDGPAVQLLGDPLAVLEHGQTSGPPRPLATVRVPRTRPRTARGMNTAGPTPAATIGWAARGSAPASARTTASPVRTTSPATEPWAGKTVPRSRSASDPSAASTARRSPSIGQGQGGQLRPDQRPGVPHDQPEQLAGVGPGQDGGADGPDGLQPLRPVGRLLVQVGGLDGRARLGGEQGQGPSSSASKSSPPSFSVRYRLP